MFPPESRFWCTLALFIYCFLAILLKDAGRGGEDATGCGGSL